MLFAAMVLLFVFLKLLVMAGAWSPYPAVATAVLGLPGIGGLWRAPGGVEGAFVEVSSAPYRLDLAAVFP